MKNVKIRSQSMICMPQTISCLDWSCSSMDKELNRVEKVHPSEYEHFGEQWCEAERVYRAPLVVKGNNHKSTVAVEVLLLLHNVWMHLGLTWRLSTILEIRWGHRCFLRQLKGSFSKCALGYVMALSNALYTCCILSWQFSQFTVQCRLTYMPSIVYYSWLTLSHTCRVKVHNREMPREKK